MASLTFGAFRELYRGSGIYWAGSFNVEGDGHYRLIAEARAVIDQDIIDREARQAKKLAEKIASGRYLVAYHNQDGSVTVHTPEGKIEIETLRKARQQLWDIEDKFNMEFIWSN